MKKLCLILGALVTAAVWYATQLLFVQIDDLTATGNAYWLLIQSVIILLPWVLITGKIYGNNDSWWWGSFAFFGTLRAFWLCYDTYTAVKFVNTAYFAQMSVPWFHMILAAVAVILITRFALNKAKDWANGII